MCKEVAPQIVLAQICQQFAANQFYLGILQLCLTCAKKQDPKNIALHWYKNKEPVGTWNEERGEPLWEMIVQAADDDLEGYDAYMKRLFILVKNFFFIRNFFSNLVFLG